MKHMNVEEFKELCVGDLVTIRDYNEMIADGTLKPLDGALRINSRIWTSMCKHIRFNKQKENMCGKEFAIHNKDVSEGLLIAVIHCPEDGINYSFPISTLQSPITSISIDESLFDSLLGKPQ